MKSFWSNERRFIHLVDHTKIHWGQSWTNIFGDGVTYSCQMSQANWEANGQGCRAHDVTPPFISDCNDTQHQLEGGQKLNAHSLAGGDTVKLWVFRGGGNKIQSLEWKEWKVSLHWLYADILMLSYYCSSRVIKSLKLQIFNRFFLPNKKRWFCL